MLPQRLATWLSATRNTPSGMAAIKLRNGVAIEDAVAEVAEHHDVGRDVRDLLGRARSTMRSEIERLSSVSTFSRR